MTDEPSFMTPTNSEQVAREAEIMLLRSMTRTLDGISATMTAHGTAIGDIKTDVAVIKERQRGAAEVKEKVDALEAEIGLLKARNDKQDGAMTIATLLKDFGPWVVSLLLLFWGLFSRK